LFFEHIGLSKKYSILETPASKEFVGKSLGELNVRAKYGINIIAIKKKIPTINKQGSYADEDAINASPEAHDVIEEGDILVVVGCNESIEKLKKKT